MHVQPVDSWHVCQFDADERYQSLCGGLPNRAQVTTDLKAAVEGVDTIMASGPTANPLVPFLARPATAAQHSKPDALCVLSGFHFGALAS
jgi:hypothetical protein